MPLSTHFIGLTQERVGVCSVCSFCIYSVDATVIWLPEYVKCLKFTSGNISRNVNLQIFQGTALHKAVSCKVRLYLQRLTMTVSSSAPSSASGYFELAVMNSSSVAHARIVGSKSSTVSRISDIAAVAFIALSQLLRLELAVGSVSTTVLVSETGDDKSQIVSITGNRKIHRPSVNSRFICTFQMTRERQSRELTT